MLSKTRLSHYWSYLTAVPPKKQYRTTLPLLIYIFQLTYRHLICCSSLWLILTDPLHIFTALNSSPQKHMTSNSKRWCISGISAPADTWYVIRFTVRTVHCQKHICNFSAKRRFSVDRRLTDKSIQEDLIDRKWFVLLLNKIYFPRKNRKNQTVMFLFMPVIRPELSMDCLLYTSPSPRD